MDGASSSGVAGPFSFPRPREPPSFSISSRTSSLPRLPGLLFPRAFATCWSLHCGWRIVLSITTTSSSHVVYVVVDSSISCGFDWNLERETVGDETRNRPVRSPIPLRFRRGVSWRCVAPSACSASETIQSVSRARGGSEERWRAGSARPATWCNGWCRRRWP